MAKKGNKYKVGFLAILFIILLVVCLMSLGIMKFFLPKIEFITATSSSIQGLSEGAKVKIKGVTVGQVSKIQLAMHGEYVYIFMEFDPSSFSKQSDMEIDKNKIKKFFYDNLKKQVAKGLRCQLQYEGITGALCVEIRHFDMNKYKTEEVALPPDLPPYIPSVAQASIGNMLEDAQTTLKKISRINFKQITGKLDHLLTTTEALLNNNDPERIISEIGEISNNLKEMTSSFNSVINKARITEMTDNLKDAVIDAKLFMGQLRQDLNEANLSQTANSIRLLIRNTNSLIEYFNMNPDSIIKGRSGHSAVPAFGKKNH
jgi:ABC-type transporter Mla subunit MlaD